MDKTNILSALNMGGNQTLYPGHREIRARGWQEAEKYPTPRDCEVVIFDADPESDHIYIKVTDSNGGEQFARYRLVEDPIPKFEPDKFVTTNDFNKFKEEMTDGFNSIRQLITSTATAAEQSARSNDSSKQSGRRNNEFRGSETDLQPDGK